jgi:hypothetical protein
LPPGKILPETGAAFILSNSDVSTTIRACANRARRVEPGVQRRRRPAARTAASLHGQRWQRDPQTGSALKKRLFFVKDRILCWAIST